MTPQEFQRIGTRMYGRKHWRREYSVNLGIDPSTVWRISTREQDIPSVMEVAVKGLLDKHKSLTRASKALAEQRAKERHRYKGKLTHKKRKKKSLSRKLIPYAGSPDQRKDNGHVLEASEADPANNGDAG